MKPCHNYAAGFFGQVDTIIGRNKTLRFRSLKTMLLHTPRYVLDSFYGTSLSISASSGVSGAVVSSTSPQPGFLCIVNPITGLGAGRFIRILYRRGGTLPHSYPEMVRPEASYE